MVQGFHGLGLFGPSTLSMKPQLSGLSRVGRLSMLGPPGRGEQWISKSSSKGFVGLIRDLLRATWPQRN